MFLKSGNCDHYAEDFVSRIYDADKMSILWGSEYVTVRENITFLTESVKVGSII